MVLKKKKDFNCKTITAHEYGYYLFWMKYVENCLFCYAKAVLFEISFQISTSEVKSSCFTILCATSVTQELSILLVYIASKYEKPECFCSLLRHYVYF